MDRVIKQSTNNTIFKNNLNTKSKLVQKLYNQNLGHKNTIKRILVQLFLHIARYLSERPVYNVIKVAVIMAPI